MSPTVGTSCISHAPVIADIEIDYGNDLSNTVTIIAEVEWDFEYQIDEVAPQASSIFDNVLLGRHTVTVRDVTVVVWRSKKL
ncbi:hypothetical protein ACNR9Q_07830 [Maribacter sp. X9]|uniref:hypothetical protein n=1 Tax=Maribacter sp. X9 TaxID=3402159 RepID=UPI003AF3D5D5